MPTLKLPLEMGARFLRVRLQLQRRQIVCLCLRKAPQFEEDAAEVHFRRGVVGPEPESLPIVNDGFFVSAKGRPAWRRNSAGAIPPADGRILSDR